MLRAALSSAQIAFLVPNHCPAGGLPARLTPQADAETLPRAALTRLGTLRWRHGTKVRTVAFAPDGQMLATADAEGIIRIWDRAGRELRRWRQGAQQRIQIAFSPDCKLLASSDGPVIHMWEPAAGRERHRLTVHPGEVYDLAFSPDGRTLATGGAVEVRSVQEDGVPPRRELGPGVVVLWDVTRRVRLREWVANPEPGLGLAVAWSPDGKRIATCWGRECLCVWDASTGHLLRHFTTYHASGYAVSFLPNGKTLVLTGHEGAIHYWDVPTGRLLRSDGCISRQAFALAVSPDGKTLATAGCNLTLWDADTGKICEPPPAGSCEPCVAFAPDGKTVVAPCGPTLAWWDAATGRPLESELGHSQAITAAGFAADAQTEWTAGADGTLRTWTPNGTTLSSCQVPDAAHRLAVSADGRTLAMDAQEGRKVSRVLLRDLTGNRTAAAIAQLPGHTLGLVFSPDGKTLAWSAGWVELPAEGPEQIWFALGLADAATGRPKTELGRHVGRVADVAFSPDGGRLLVLTTEPNPALRAWDVATGREVRSPAPGLIPGERFVLSPDGNLLAVLGPSRMESWQQTAWPYERAALQLWETATGRPAAAVDAASGHVNCAAFAPDGRLLAFGDGAGVRVWDVATWTERTVLCGHLGRVTALAFSPDGRRLISGSADTTAVVWDLRLLPTRPASETLTDGQMEGLWDDLAAADAARGWRAVGALASAPAQAVPLLRRHLRPARTLTPEHIAKWVKDLDNIDFLARERATVELGLLGELAEASLREAALKPRSPEARRRANWLLEAQRAPGLSSEELRVSRALQALRHMGGAEALRLAETFLSGR
jgi:WD40 repeat protein